jgi:uncharacterized membrane protein YkoI
MIRKINSLLLLVCLTLVAQQGFAVPKQEGIGRQQAIAIVKNNYPGKVLKAQLKSGPKRSFYQVKVLTKDGRVKLFRVNSRSGELLKPGKTP